jgi:hypothetical protein
MRRDSAEKEGKINPKQASLFTTCILVRESSLEGVVFSAYYEVKKKNEGWHVYIYSHMSITIMPFLNL